MQVQNARRVLQSTFAALLPLLSVAAALAQSAPAVLSVRGRMTTSADITDRFVFRIPAETTNLTIRVPIPTDANNSGSLAEGEQVGDVNVVATQQPDSETNQRDAAGNLYKVLTYQHVMPGALTVSSELLDVKTAADLDTPLPRSPLPLLWMPQNVQRYLDPTHLVQSDDERIVLLARKIAGSAGSESEAAQAIMMWLQNRINYSMTGATLTRTDAISTLTLRGGVCEGWAHLFLALARASGIPCRYVGGYCIGGSISYPVSASNMSNVSVSMPSQPHAWVEVWYPGAGWVPYDPQTSSGFVDSHHVPIWIGLDGNSEFPILTWELSEGADSACSFAEEESTSNINDDNELHCDTGANFYGGSGPQLLFCR